jgi:hypothetical protein
MNEEEEKSGFVTGGCLKAYFYAKISKRLERARCH